jgi:GNAT superfamily N-acetyltransferase
LFWKSNRSQCRSPNKMISLDKFKQLKSSEMQKLSGVKVLYEDEEEWEKDYLNKVFEMKHLQWFGLPRVTKVMDIPDEVSEMENLKMVQIYTNDKSPTPMNLYWKQYSSLPEKDHSKEYIITQITSKNHDIVKHLRLQVDDMQGFLVTKDFRHYVVWANLESKRGFAAVGYLAFFKRGNCQILSQIMVLEEFRRQRFGSALYNHFKNENKKFTLVVERPEPSFCSLIYREEGKEIDKIGCFVTGDFYVMSKWMASFYEEEYDNKGRPLGKFRYSDQIATPRSYYRKIIHVWLAYNDGLICKSSTSNSQTRDGISPFLTVPVLLEDLKPFELELELAPYLPKNFKIEPVCEHKMYKNEMEKEWIDIYVLNVDENTPITKPTEAPSDLCFKKHKLKQFPTRIS